ncbi:MAG: hypothetical protein P8H03_09145 [Emcibacteraceae bacterium]|nr:hypothetical protein [Emcibacteraceae bacterium]MDG1858262.1 hypothetical protein [Emcibacteraceae bacterium]
MSKEKNYTEYWEQYFYLNDGSLVTSQFLVANFPWPVGKDHGIMLGTLITPEGELYVIKNGRGLGDWGYKEDALDIFLHTHRLSGNGDDVNVHLENTMAVIDLSLKSEIKPLKHNRYSSEDGFIETSFYAPSMVGHGNWQLGEEAGFEPSGPVHNADKVDGFGVHVTMTDKVDKLIKNWTRVSGIGTGPKPFLSAITRPDDKEEIIFKLFDGDQTLDTFKDVKINFDNMTKEKDATYPKKLKISAVGQNGKIEGVVTFTKKMDHFSLTDHLNFFEKSFAKSNPRVTNFRYIADYNLVYKTSEGETVLSGKALSEYTDIQAAGSNAKKKRRRSRR